MVGSHWQQSVALTIAQIQQRQESGASVLGAEVSLNNLDVLSDDEFGSDEESQMFETMELDPAMIGAIGDIIRPDGASTEEAQQELHQQMLQALFSRAETNLFHPDTKCAPCEPPKNTHNISVGSLAQTKPGATEVGNGEVYHFPVRGYVVNIEMEAGSKSQYCATLRVGKNPKNGGKDDGVKLHFKLDDLEPPDRFSRPRNVPARTNSQEFGPRQTAEDFNFLWLPDPRIYTFLSEQFLEVCDELFGGFVWPTNWKKFRARMKDLLAKMKPDDGFASSYFDLIQKHISDFLKPVVDCIAHLDSTYDSENISSGVNEYASGGSMSLRQFSKEMKQPAPFGVEFSSPKYRRIGDSNRGMDSQPACSLHDVFSFAERLNKMRNLDCDEKRWDGSFNDDQKSTGWPTPEVSDRGTVEAAASKEPIDGISEFASMHQPSSSGSILPPPSVEAPASKDPSSEQERTITFTDKNSAVAALAAVVADQFLLDTLVHSLSGCVNRLKKYDGKRKKAIWQEAKKARDDDADDASKSDDGNVNADDSADSNIMSLADFSSSSSSAEVTMNVGDRYGCTKLFHCLLLAIPLLPDCPRDDHGLCVVPHPHRLIEEKLKKIVVDRRTGRFLTNKVCDNCQKTIGESFWYHCEKGCDIDFCKNCHESLEGNFRDQCQGGREALSRGVRILELISSIFAKCCSHQRRALADQFSTFFRDYSYSQSKLHPSSSEQPPSSSPESSSLLTDIRKANLSSADLKASMSNAKLQSAASGFSAIVENHLDASEAVVKKFRAYLNARSVHVQDVRDASTDFSFWCMLALYEAFYEVSVETNGEVCGAPETFVLEGLNKMEPLAECQRLNTHALPAKQFRVLQPEHAQNKDELKEKCDAYHASMELSLWEVCKSKSWCSFSHHNHLMPTGFFRKVLLSDLMIARSVMMRHASYFSRRFSNQNITNITNVPRTNPDKLKQRATWQFGYSNSVESTHAQHIRDRRVNGLKTFPSWFATWYFDRLPALGALMKDDVGNESDIAMAGTSSAIGEDDSDEDMESAVSGEVASAMLNKNI